MAATDGRGVILDRGARPNQPPSDAFPAAKRNSGSGFVAGCFVAVGSKALFVDFVEDVGELSSIEHLAAELAHNELSVLLASDDADLRMFA